MGGKWTRHELRVVPQRAVRGFGHRCLGALGGGRFIVLDGGAQKLLVSAGDKTEGLMRSWQGHAIPGGGQVCWLCLSVVQGWICSHA